MSSYDEPARPLEFIQSHLGEISFDEETLTASQGALLPGTVMARVTSTGNLVPYDDDANGTTAGVGIAVGILCYHVPNSASTQKVTVLKRLAQVKSSLLVWEASNDNTEKAAALAELAAQMIIART